jgi:tRNA(Ile)-lysidine synthase
MDTFRTRVAATIARHRMIAPGETVLVAYSAGADSTALLHAFVQLKDRLGCRICACHIHHGLRGRDADADAEHAARFAESLGVPFTSARADTRTHAKERKLSTETAARELRYQLLEQAAECCHAARIATGHTADDQAETVLLNLLRGAGPTGISGMAPRRGSIIRPLIDLTHADVEEYCRANGLAHRVDESNQDLRFTRNRIRHEILPALARIQPNIVAALCRLADIMREEDDYVSTQARNEADRLELHEDALDGLPISIRDFAALHPALRRRLARLAIARAKGGDRDIEMERVEALVHLLTAGRTGAAIHLPGGLTALRTYREVLIHRPEKAESPPTGEWSLPLPGDIEIEQLGFGFSLTASTSKRRPQTPNTALLDAAAVTEPLRVRTWRPGDRFVPLGMTQSVKLQDFFVNAKVPRALRPWVPLVLSRDTIVFVVGHRISDQFKVTANTRRTIRIEATQHFFSSKD